MDFTHVSLICRVLILKINFQGEDGPTVNVTVILGGRSVVLAMAFTYVSSLNPVIVSLSRNGSGIAGKIPHPGGDFHFRPLIL